MGSHIYHQEVDIVPPPTTRKCKEKNVSQRGGGGGGVGFTQEEDKVLCSAFLNIGKDPITGVGQSLGSYNKRFHDYYNMFKPEGSNRSQLAVQNRWTSIKKSVSKFSRIKSAIDRRNESGKNEQDRVDLIL
ncbi:hypothetical protein PR202_gb25650 [Eleusine coracana subsp. coracana]|uniref:Uncharacterized protein n=1 Tax=Eleusine coracana subsp. coracana TaxID=191504 RepID=A0AAV5FPT1_ELECO|nr:hypothetical protein PR202_gb25650 [Eleusine coracana subsp. coracana]